MVIFIRKYKCNKINWSYLSENSLSIYLLEQNLNKVNWKYLLKNYSAIDLLKKIKIKINWKLLSKNKNIFEIDYDYLRERLKNTFGEELIMNRFHPSNFDKWSVWGFEIF